MLFEKDKEIQSKPCTPTPSPSTPTTDIKMQPLAIATVRDQIWEELYEPDVAFSRGTIFPELDKPFLADKTPRS